MSLIIFSLLPAHVLAEPECTESRLRNSQITILNCTGDEEITSVCAPGGVTLMEGSDNAEKTWNFFISQGLKPHQAAGFMGNMQEEAHFEPRLVEYGFDNGKGQKSKANSPTSLVDDVPPDVNKKNGQPGYGIIQWTFPTRKQALRDKVANDPAKRKAGDLLLQLEYMWQELTGSYKKSTLDPVRNAGTVEEATAIVTNNYEIPGGNRAKKISSRTQSARGFLVKYGSLTPTTAPPAPATPDATAPPTGTTTTTTIPGLTSPVDPSQSISCQSSVNGAITASPSAAGIAFMALYYAWPEGGHGLTPKPEYAAGVKKYNPNANKSGADCGAFVGTVMHATGADKNYPLGGTSTQMAYVKKNSAKYDVTNNFTVADLLPGDILIVEGNGGFGHTYIFVGDQGAGRNKADASIGKRMPNLGTAEASDKSRGHYTRARLKAVQ